MLPPQLFSPVRGFLDLEHTSSLATAQVALFGVPFDMGVHPSRVGSRLGPSSIREHCTILDRYDPHDPGCNPYAQLGVVDCGDVKVAAGKFDLSCEIIEEAVGAVLQHDTVPFGWGGDGSISLPISRALAKRHDGLVLLHFDAHTDTCPAPEQGLHTTGTTFTYAAQEKRYDVERSFHIGPRGPNSFAGVFEHTRAQGFRLIPDRDMRARGIDDVIAEVKDVIGARPVYLCWDMDFYDPSCAPGVCNPVWGGITAREGFEIIRLLQGLNVVAVDINTVSPPHDAAGMTALLAGATTVECLYMLARTAAAGA